MFHGEWKVEGKSERGKALHIQNHEVENKNKTKQNNQCSEICFYSVRSRFEIIFQLCIPSKIEILIVNNIHK